MSGFSLVELVLVVAITMILAAIVSPRYGSAAVRYRADLAARRVADDLRLAQAHARLTSASCTVKFATAAEQYQLVGVASLDGASGDYTVDLRTDPYDAGITSADFGGAPTVVFSGWGLPNSGGSVVVTSGSEARTVLVDGQTGQVSIQ
jgi:type II secretory pathway pseudopilin PulG